MDAQKINSRTKSVVLIALFSALIAVGGFIRIPFPIMPITFQTFFVMISALVLGGKRASISVLIYICIGLIGIPIFTGGGGLAYVVYPTFGYLVGFVIASFVTGTLANKFPSSSIFKLICFCLVGTIFTYLFGMFYYYFITNFYLQQAFPLKSLFLYCFLLTIPSDIITISIACVISKRLKKVLKL